MARIRILSLLGLRATSVFVSEQGHVGGELTVSGGVEGERRDLLESVHFI